MRTHIGIDDTGVERRYYFKNFKPDQYFLVDNVNIILYNFTKDTIDALKKQEFDLDNIKLFVLHKMSTITPDWMSYSLTADELLSQYVDDIIITHGFYIKKLNTFNYRKKNNNFQLGIPNAILIYPSMIHLLASKEIKNYLRSKEFNDIGMELLKKRLCQETMFDLKNTLEPNWNYDDF